MSLAPCRERYIYEDVFIKRFFASLKNELIYLKDSPTEQKMREFIEEYIIDYNSMRPHSSHNYQPPDWPYFTVFSNSPVTDENLAQRLEEIRIRKQNTLDKQEFVRARVVPEEIKNKIVSEYLAGASQIALSRKCQYNYEIIARVLKQNGVDLSKEALAKRRQEATERRSGYKEEDIVALYLSGKSIPAIEKICGISSSPICRVLKKYNIPMRISRDYTKEKPRAHYSTKHRRRRNPAFISI